MREIFHSKTREESLRDRGLEFEYFMRSTMTWQLNLSPSKQVAVEMIFSRFADFVRPLAISAPREFYNFFQELILRMKRISTWRAPRGTKVVLIIYKDRPEIFQNGKCRYYLSNKPNVNNS